MYPSKVPYFLKWLGYPSTLTLLYLIRNAFLQFLPPAESLWKSHAPLVAIFPNEKILKHGTSNSLSQLSNTPNGFTWLTWRVWYVQENLSKLLLIQHPTSNPTNQTQPLNPNQHLNTPTPTNQKFTHPNVIHLNSTALSAAAAQPIHFLGSLRRYEELRITCCQLQRRIGPAGSGEATLGGGKNGGMTEVM